jgi:carbohydrate kinase (thermoresistant glucokinase family)
MLDRTQVNIPKQIVIMGVSGSGKSSIGILLAREAGMQFIDGDDIHPQANKEKMASGVPLNDEDRWPWLDLVGLSLQMPGGAIVACSALKVAYRDRIRALAPDVAFVHLTGSFDLLNERLGGRKDHFMPATLLQSQLDTLQQLEPQERGVVAEVGGSELEILLDVTSKLQSISNK